MGESTVVGIVTPVIIAGEARSPAIDSLGLLPSEVFRTTVLTLNGSLITT